MLGRVLLMAILVAFLPRAADAQAIRARVVDARNGDPVVGATVLLKVRTDKGFTDEHETETDADGRFALDRPMGAADPDIMVFVYRFGYVVWSNAVTFRVPRGRPVVRWHVPEADDADGNIPQSILLAPFPSDGWRPTHAQFLWLIANADGRRAQRPRFWQAIQQERDEALKQCGKDCD